MAAAFELVSVGCDQPAAAGRAEQLVEGREHPPDARGLEGDLGEEAVDVRG